LYLKLLIKFKQNFFRKIMADFEDDDEEDNIINEDMNKFNELGLIRDSDYANQINYSDKGKANINKYS